VEINVVNIEKGYFLELMNSYHIAENYSLGVKQSHSTNLSNLKAQFTRRMNPMAL